MIRANLQRNIACLFWRNSPFIEKSHFSSVSETKPLKNPTVLEYLIQKHKFSPEVASRVDSVLDLAETPEKCDLALSYLKEIGFTKSDLEKTFKCRPHLLLASVDKIIKPKMKIFEDRGFSSKDIVSLISKQSGILEYSANKRIIPSLFLLKDLFGSNENVAKVLRKSGWLLQADLEKSMVPNIEYLKSCGVDMDQILILVNCVPRLLLHKPEFMRKCVEKVEQMGVDRNSKMFIYAVETVGSMGNGMWELKLQAFQNILEFSDEDLSRVLRQHPKAFSVSEDKMKKVKEVLLATRKYSTSSILKYPKALLYSIEKRYKPRLDVLAILERRNLMKHWPSLGILCRLSDTKFFNVFVGPYLDDPEISTLYKDHPMIKGP